MITNYSTCLNMLLEHGTSYTLFEANETLSNKSNNKKI